MAKGYLLSEDDVRFLRKLRRWFDHVVVGSESNEYARHPNQASDVYIARVPAGGIPALSDVGTAGDTPGSATCQIYKIDSSGVLVDAGFSLTVYNLSREPIDSKYVPVYKTKFGKWVAHTEEEYGTGTGTGTGTAVCEWLNIDNIPTTGTPLYILAMDGAGCLYKVLVSECP